MSTQSEAALEAGLITTLQQMDYEYVQIVEEDNLYADVYKRQEELSLKSGVGLRFVPDLEQGNETLRLDKVNQLLSLIHIWNRFTNGTPREDTS